MKWYGNSGQTNNAYGSRTQRTCCRWAMFMITIQKWHSFERLRSSWPAGVTRLNVMIFMRTVTEYSPVVVLSEWCLGGWPVNDQCSLLILTLAMRLELTKKWRKGQLVPLRYGRATPNRDKNGDKPALPSHLVMVTGDWWWFNSQWQYLFPSGGVRSVINVCVFPSIN